MSIRLEETAYDKDYEEINSFDRLIGVHTTGISLITRTFERYGQTIEVKDIELSFDGTNFVLITERDCCNRVWFESIDNVEAMQDAEILSYSHRSENRDTDDIYEEDEDEIYTRRVYLDVAFLRINTNKGACVIETRNSHNGYYGGLLRLITRDEYNGMISPPEEQEYEA